MRARLNDLASSPILAPLMLALFPVMFLWARNARAGVGIRSVAVTALAALLFTALLFSIAYVIMRSPKKASIATCVLVALFFSFGHVAASLNVRLGSIEESGLLIAYLLLAFAGVLMAASRGEEASPTLFRTISFVAVVLIAMNTFSLARLDAEAPISQSAVWSPQVDGWTMPSPARDVYYLIFDRYANEATLAQQYGFDNSSFLASLEDQGFYVVHDAVANYPQTTHSLASSLNMDHLHALASAAGEDSTDWRPLQRSLWGFAAAQAFQSMGYRYVHIGSWWGQTSTDPTADVNDQVFGPGEFAQVFLDSTAWPALASRVGTDAYDARHIEFERVPLQFAAVRDVASDPAPTFTFAHFLLPHPPYVFNEDGTFATSPDRPIAEAYLEQLKATNGMIQSLVHDLLIGPNDEDPIVIVQSDEGPYPVDLEGSAAHVELPTQPSAVLERKLRILNAYYFPGAGADRALYPTITPVNSFRVLFDSYFDAKLPLLPDRTFVFADDDHPYDFVDVTDRLSGERASP